jgi:hypothetical protein
MRLIYKIQNFIKSLIWHAYSGFPKSSQELINQRYDICKSCDMFDFINSQCLLCGCNLSKKKVFLNKLAWKDQKCPSGKW